MRRRVETAAAELQLRCATARVLSAVLTLLLGWNRVRDDRVRVHHIAARFPAGSRLVTATTIGRLLAKLDELALIVYRPAIGRGAFAEIAIHPRFLEGIAEMVYTGRRGRNMVPPTGDSEAEIIAFSGRGFLIGDLPPHPPLQTRTLTRSLIPDRWRSWFLSEQSRRSSASSPGSTAMFLPECAGSSAPKSSDIWLEVGAQTKS